MADGFEATINGDGYAATANPMADAGISAAAMNLELAETRDDIKTAVSSLVEAVKNGFNKFIEDQRVRNQTVADADAAASSSSEAANDATSSATAVRGVVNQENLKVVEEVKQGSKKSSGLIGVATEKLTNFTNSINPILPSLKTFGIAFATTSLATMFLVNTMISAIKFIFANPGMFLGALIGGTFLFQIFREPIMGFLSSIVEKLKQTGTTYIRTGIAFILKEIFEVIKTMIGNFFGRIKEFGLSVFNTAKEMFSGLMDNLGKVWESLKTFVGEAIDSIVEIPEKIGDFIGTMIARVPELISKIVSGFNEFISSSSIIKGAMSAFNSVSSVVKKLYPIIVKAVNTIGGAIAKFANLSPSKMVGKAAGAAKGALSWFKGKVGGKNNKDSSKDGDVSSTKIVSSEKEEKPTVGSTEIVTKPTREDVKIMQAGGESYGRDGGSIETSSSSGFGSSTANTNGNINGSSISPSNIGSTNIVDKNAFPTESLKSFISEGLSKSGDNLKSSVSELFTPIKDGLSKIGAALEKTSKEIDGLVSSSDGLKDSILTSMKGEIKEAIGNGQPSGAAVIIGGTDDTPEGLRNRGVEPPEE